MISFLISFLCFRIRNPQNAAPNGVCPTYSVLAYITSSCSTYGREYVSNSHESVYHVDSRKSGFSVVLDSCNFSKYQVSSGYFLSLININGSRVIRMNVKNCYFHDNTMTITQTGVFYAFGPHEINIDFCIFQKNQGNDASVFGGNCSKLSITNSVVFDNRCNSMYGQIYLKSYPSSNPNSISFSNLTMKGNEGWTTVNRNYICSLLNFSTYSFKDCYFTCGSTQVNNLIMLNGVNFEATFQDCCFFVDYKFYPMLFYHIFIDYNSKGITKFVGTNMFSGDQSKAFSKKMDETDNEIYNIESCDLDDPTTTTSSNTLSTSSGSDTDVSKSSSVTNDGDDVDDGGSDNATGALKPGYIALICLIILILIIVGIVIGWFVRKKFKENEQNHAARSLFEDFNSNN